MLEEDKDESWAIWAFGNDVWIDFKFCELDTMDLMEAWNRVHSDLMRLDPDDQIWYAIKKMKRYYEQHKRRMNMDKKMKKVTKSMKVAEKDIRKGKASEAVKVLKGAEKKNDKLVAMDKKRDVIIDKAKKGKC